MWQNQPQIHETVILSEVTIVSILAVYDIIESVTYVNYNIKTINVNLKMQYDSEMRSLLLSNIATILW